MLTIQAITSIGSLNLVALCFACFVGGRPCEILGIRKTFLFGSICVVVGMLGASWCSSVGTLILTQGKPMHDMASPRAELDLGLVSGFGGGLLFLTGSACMSNLSARAQG